MSERLEATVHGRVQGVGFRWFVVREAETQGVTGWVANRRDGTVRVVAEGPAPALDDLLARLHEGPRGAHVERVDSRRGPAAGTFEAFAIRSEAHSGD